MAVARAAGVVGRRYFGIMATRRMQMEWFDRLSDHYLDQPLRFFQSQPTGKLLAHADNDAERSAFAMQPLPLSLGAVVLLVFASISLAVLDPLLLLIGLLLFPTLIVMNRLYTARVEGPSARAQAHVGDGQRGGARELRGRAGRQAARPRGARGRPDAGRVRAAARTSGWSSAVSAPRSSPRSRRCPRSAPSPCWRSARRGSTPASITTGDLVQAMTLFGILAFPMRVVGFLLEELPRSVVSRDRIVDVLDADHAADAVLVDDDERAPSPPRRARSL